MSPDHCLIVYFFHKFPKYFPPAGASLQLVPNSEFSLHPPHSTTAHCPPLFWRGGTGVRTSPPLARACSSCPIQNSQFSLPPTCPICPTCPTRPTIQNSQFKIHNLPIPLALFKAHYRLKKLFSLCIGKEK